MQQEPTRKSGIGRLAGRAALLLALVAVGTGALLARGLWWLLPHLALCFALLLVLWHQTILNRRHMAMLDRLERSLSGLIAAARATDDAGSRAHDEVRRDDPEALAASRIRTIDKLLQRR